MGKLLKDLLGAIETGITKAVENKTVSLPFKTPEIIKSETVRDNYINKIDAYYLPKIQALENKLEALNEKYNGKIADVQQAYMSKNWNPKVKDNYIE